MRASSRIGARGAGSITRSIRKQSRNSNALWVTSKPAARTCSEDHGAAHRCFFALIHQYFLIWRGERFYERRRDERDGERKIWPDRLTRCEWWERLLWERTDLRKRRPDYLSPLHV